jgi:Mg-chelatase subunit ChlD
MFRLVLIILATAIAINGQLPETPTAAASPLTVGLVVDNSGSYRSLLDRVVDVVSDLVDEKGGEDEMFLVTFVDTSKIVLRQDLTHVKGELHDAAEKMFIEGGQTAILDALKFAAKEFEKLPSERPRILILISDGDERSSAAKMADVIKDLKDLNIRVFALGLADGYLNAKFLERITKETGGAKFIPKSRAQISEVTKQVWPAIRATK